MQSVTAQQQQRTGEKSSGEMGACSFPPFRFYAIDAADAAFDTAVVVARMARNSRLEDEAASSGRSEQGKEGEAVKVTTIRRSWCLTRKMFHSTHCVRYLIINNTRKTHIFTLSQLFKHLRISNEYALSDLNIRILRQNVNLVRSPDS